MLKKLGLVTVGVTAGLVAVAPLASAAESQVDDNHNVTTETDNVGVDTGNVIGQGNGQHNTLNGAELPGPPDAPAPPELPSAGALHPELPSQLVIPGA